MTFYWPVTKLVRGDGCRASPGHIEKERKMWRYYYIVIFVLVTSLVPGRAAHADLRFTLASDTLFGGTGSSVAVSGILTNTGAAPVFLNGALSFILPPDLGIDDEPFFLNPPPSLSPGASFTGTLFAVEIGPQAGLGTYQGSFTIQGGADENAFETLASATFSVQVVVDTTPPVVTVAATPATLWPANGKMVGVTISGSITDPESGVNARSAAYAVTDEYGEVHPSGSVPLQPNGAYSFTIQLRASRLESDMDGRQYVVTVSADNAAGSPGSASTRVIVPHDMRK